MEKDKDLLQDYFKDDIARLEEEFNKTEELFKIASERIQTFSSTGSASRGTEHYLIEHIENAVSIQKQKSEILKDIVSIKKIALDAKNKAKDEDEIKSLSKLVYDQFQQQKEIILNEGIQTNHSEEEIDEEIDKILKNVEE